MSRHNAQEPMDRGDLGPKHRLFLCHSGAQKGFVEQLDKDLRSVDRYPFFDKDRESLPIGDNFPSLIFEAIEHCQVGVVFLSEEFFMRSPWPMFEVVKMVECGRRIMPVFLGISPGDLSNEEKVAKWKSTWEDWAKCNGRIDVAKWESTLRSLRPLNGLLYNDAVGEVKFREEIVREVKKIVRAFHVWDDSHVQGKSRIGKLIQRKILETPMSKKGVQVVGLYGVGGIGKTTACKSLCKDLDLEFDGRVCHIEFGDDTREIDRVREVLERLTNTNVEFLKTRTKDQCWSRLKGLLGLNKVVLAIDNVSANAEICNEARRYLSLEYGQGSVVMVTARALGELENLGIRMGCYLEMPELMEEEAKALFLYHAKPESALDEKVVMKCISRCYFGKGDGDGSKHYHPLTLRVLGSQLVGRHPSKWQPQLGVLNELQEDEDSVFSILRRSFDTLDYKYKMLFMDVALFDDGHRIRSLLTGNRFHEIDPNRGFNDFDWLTWHTIFEWLGMVHGVGVGEVKRQLNELKKRSLLEELGDGRRQIGMHDLWREFAVMQTKRGEEGRSEWVFEHYGLGDEQSVESCMSGGGWKRLRRICIEKNIVKRISFSNCSNVTVLRLYNVWVENGALDVSQLKSMKSLEIVRICYSHPKKGDTMELKQQRVSGIGQLMNLEILIWMNFGNEPLSVVEEISCLTNLRVLHLRLAVWIEQRWSLDLQQLRYLQDVRVKLPCLVSISGFSSEMRDLRNVDLGGCCELRSCVGVGDVDGLEVLRLGQCERLEELESLQKLTRLRMLGIRCCSGLKCIPGLGNLVALRYLCAYCPSLHDLPDRGNLTSLQKVVISGLDLFKFWSSCEVPGSVLNLAMLECVSALEIDHVDHEVMNLSKLTALKSLELTKCNIDKFPRLGGTVTLESLKILHCRWLKGWDGLLGSVSELHSQVDWSSDWTFPNLKELQVEVFCSLELPDLRHFPQLRTLCVDGGDFNSERAEFIVHCHAIHVHLEILKISHSEITELPDLGKFPSLQTIDIWRCKDLMNLTISEPLRELRRITLKECSILRTAPDVSFFPRLTSFQFNDCGVQLNEHEVEKLIARGFRHTGDGAFWRERCSEVALPPGDELKYSGDEQVAVHSPNNLGSGSLSSEPCTSESIPFQESLSKLEMSSVPKRALELGSSSGSDQEQTKKLKNIE